MPSASVIIWKILLDFIKNARACNEHIIRIYVKENLIEKIELYVC